MNKISYRKHEKANAEELPSGKPCPFERMRDSPSKGKVTITVGTHYCQNCRYNRGVSKDTCRTLCVCKSLRERSALSQHLKASKMTDKEREERRIARRKRYESNKEHEKQMAREYAKIHKEERKEYVKRTSDLRSVRNRVHRMERILFDDEM